MLLLRSKVFDFSHSVNAVGFYAKPWKPIFIFTRERSRALAQGYSLVKTKMDFQKLNIKII